METIFFDRLTELKRTHDELEKRLKVTITIEGKRVIIRGNTFEEYEALTVLEAMNFGFSAQTALMLKDEDIVFRRIHIKDFTNRKDLETVKARIIGTQGRTKRTIENLANCEVMIKGNEVGLICPAEEIDYVITGMTNLIRGSKQANVYKFLERINTARKNKNKE
jgi:ribosomal RNA assembly protein